MQIIQLVEQLSQRFIIAGVENAKRVAEELVADLLETSPLGIYLISQPFPEEKQAVLELLSLRIEQGEPLQYVVGHVDFRGVKIRCDTRALIPRPETEMLVEELLNAPIWNADAPRIADVGTGSGCIVLALAMEHPEAKFIAVDLSKDALDLAQENAKYLDLAEQIQWKQGSLLSGFAPASLDAVVANLPYISPDDWRELAPCVRDYEPKMALECGHLGMELIEQLVDQARSVLCPDGMLFLEYGYNQGSAVSQCLKTFGYRDVQIKCDLAGHDRMAIAVNPPARLPN
jgi:release factor glutamine methyltransferase